MEVSFHFREIRNMASIDEMRCAVWSHCNLIEWRLFSSTDISLLLMICWILPRSICLSIGHHTIQEPRQWWSMNNGIVYRWDHSRFISWGVHRIHKLQFTNFVHKCWTRHILIIYIRQWLTSLSLYCSLMCLYQYVVGCINSIQYNSMSSDNWFISY